MAKILIGNVPYDTRQTNLWCRGNILGNARSMTKRLPELLNNNNTEPVKENIPQKEANHGRH